MVWSKWKGIYLGTWDYILQQSPIWNRSLVIRASNVGEKVQVHNGFELKSLKINESMVGYKFGEFVFTWKMWRNIHLKKKKVIKKKVK